jgi:hypothetical protein
VATEVVKGVIIAVMFRVLFVLLFYSATWMPQSLQVEQVMITIRLVNGKNGHPITDEDLNVWIDSSRDAENFRADRNGVIRLMVDCNAVVSLASNIQVTCHPYAPNERQERQYRVSEILDYGISDENLCSKKIRSEAKRGEFVFYERPRTLLEWWRL